MGFEIASKHNLILSTIVYGWDIFDIIGIPTIAIAFVSVILYCLNKKNKSLPYILLYLSLPILIVFTMYMGITVIYVPQVSINNLPGGLFNVRYALMSLPFTAIASSLLVRKRLWLATLIIGVTLFQSIYFIKKDQILVVNDATVGRESANYEGSEIANALHKYCDKQLILMSAGSYDPLFLKSNIE